MIENESLHFVGKVAQKAIIRFHNKILVCRGVGDTLWEFPGGRLNNEGSPYENLAREIQEELGMSIEEIKPYHVITSLHLRTNTRRILIGYHATASRDTYTLDPDELEEAKWISIEELQIFPFFDDCRELADYYVSSKI